MSQSIRDKLSRIYGPTRDRSALRVQLDQLSSRRYGPALSDFLKGRWVERSSGRLLAVERNYPRHYRHGTIALDDIRSVQPHLLTLLAGSGDFGGFDPARALFLDTETTGLSGGAGTCVFLVGVGFFSEDGFCVSQLFLPDYHAEQAFLEELSELMGRERFQYLISFNGKSYDLSLLENRFVLQRLEKPFQKFTHLDLLHPSRLLWRDSFKDCALQTLERHLFGLRRQGDIPSALIPRLYFNYLHSGRFDSFERIFSHNRTDILTMVALVILASRLIDEPDESLFVNPLAASRLHQIRGNHAKAAQLLERAWERRSCGRDDEKEVVLQLALLKKKLGCGREALPLLQGLIQDCDRPPVQAFTEAAKIFEHELRDFQSALTLVEKGLKIWPSEELGHRRFRLQCRTQGKRWY